MIDYLITYIFWAGPVIPSELVVGGLSVYMYTLLKPKSELTLKIGRVYPKTRPASLLVGLDMFIPKHFNLGTGAPGKGLCIRNCWAVELQRAILLMEEILNSHLPCKISVTSGINYLSTGAGFLPSSHEFVQINISGGWMMVNGNILPCWITINNGHGNVPVWFLYRELMRFN